MSGVALHADHLSVRFGSIDALSGIDLQVPEGVSVAVLGPNGSGKSTLFAAALGLVSPASGSISLSSARVAYLPQHHDADPLFPVTAEDVVRMGRYGDLGWFGRPGAHDRDLIDEAMAALEVSDLAGRRYGLLSGGQRQRVLLAQAMAQDARILLLDEPFTGVDAPTQKLVEALLQRWRDEGRTVMVATHDLEAAARDHDLVLCLNQRMIAFGRPEQVCVEPVLAETFSGRVVRVGDLVIDVAHHHHGAG